MKKVIVWASMMLALSAAGCSKNQGTPSPEAATAEGKSGNAPDAALADALSACVRVDGNQTMTAQQWADANNAFGFALLAKLSENEKSPATVLSPYSIERAVGMVYEGACGSTAAGMRKALSMPEATNISMAGAEIEKAMLGNIPNELTLAIDNRVWVEQSFALVDDFVKRVQDAYQAAPVSIDFKGDPEGSRTTINQDVAASTKDRITDILPPGAISIVTRLVLTNAVYFKAPWKDAFSPEKTTDEEFKGATANNKIRMMHHIKKHNAFINDAFVAFDMDFMADNYAFMVVLPTVAEGQSAADALQSVEAGLSAEKLREIREQMDSAKLNLSMPRFKLEAGAMLKPLLSALGMNLAFSDDADFRGINGGKDLRISDVYHKAFIEVTEEGAEAAAATAVAVNTRMMRPPERTFDVVVDHPFAFAIIEKSSGAALFIGHVRDL